MFGKEFKEEKDDYFIDYSQIEGLREQYPEVKDDYFIDYSQINGLGFLGIGKIIKKIGKIPKKIIKTTKSVVGGVVKITKKVVTAPVKATLKIGKGALKAAVKLWPPAVIARLIKRIASNSTIRNKTVARLKQEETRKGRALTTAEGQEITKQMLTTDPEVKAAVASESRLSGISDLGVNWGQLILWIAMPLFMVYYSIGKAIFGKKQTEVSVTSEGDVEILETEAPPEATFFETPPEVSESSESAGAKGFAAGLQSYLPYILGGGALIALAALVIPKLKKG